MKKKWKIIFVTCLFSITLSFNAIAEVGWTKNANGKWNYYNSNGELVRNEWIQIGNDKYRIDAQGVMYENCLIGVDGNMYYMGSDGKMVTNQWVKYSNLDYYAGTDGIILKSAITPDGYTVGANGVWDQSIPQQPVVKPETNTNEYKNSEITLTETDKQNIWDATIKATKDKLFYPNTAKFPEWGNEGVNIDILTLDGKETIYIHGWCEAKNKIGNYMEVSISAIYENGFVEIITLRH